MRLLKLGQMMALLPLIWKLKSIEKQTVENTSGTLLVFVLQFKISRESPVFLIRKCYNPIVFL